MILGCHVSLGGKDQFLGSVKEALSYHANAFMVYTGAPQNTARKPLSELRIDEALSLMEKHHISRENVIVHAPYIVNLANPDPEKQAFAVAFLIEEIIRTHALGSHIMVLHPGAHMGEGLELGITRIASNLQKIIDATSSYPVIIALETMAGKGTEVGRSFAEIHQLLEQTNRKERLGVCYDTCHTSDAGYSVKDHFEQVLEEFDQTIGLNFLKVLHVNDSKNVQGAMKDRHENFGFGTIGFDALYQVLTHPRLSSIPKILETPYVKSSPEDSEGFPPYGFEIAMIRQGIFDPNLKEKIIASKGIL